jgi:hypothetical protein
VPGLGEGFDPKRFDPIAFAPRAQEVAKQILPEPVLLTVAARVLNDEGLVDATQLSTMVNYYFEAKGGEDCARVDVHSSGVNAAATTPDYCVTKPFGTLRCTLPKMWQRATRKGKPPKGVPGTLSINVRTTGLPTWTLMYDDWTWSGRDDC